MIMLNLVRTKEEKYLLESTLPKLNVVSLELSLNKNISIKPISKPNIILIEELKKQKEFCIWYSSNSAEDLNFYYYLIDVICENIDNPIINVINVYEYSKMLDSLLCCFYNQICRLAKRKKSLTKEKIQEDLKYYRMLDNSDLRAIKDKVLVSITYEEVSKEILERLSKYNEISIITFVARDLLIPKLFSFTDIFTWDYLMESLIEEGKIKVIREEKQEDSAFKIDTRIISIE